MSRRRKRGREHAPITALDITGANNARRKIVKVQTPLETELTTLEGNPMRVGETKVVEMAGGGIQQITIETDKTWTLGSAIITALTGQYQGDNPDGNEKAHRGFLAIKLYGRKGTIDLESKDITLIKTLCGHAFPPLMVARIYSMVDPMPDADKHEEPEQS